MSFESFEKKDNIESGRLNNEFEDFDSRVNVDIKYEYKKTFDPDARIETDKSKNEDGVEKNKETDKYESKKAVDSNIKVDDNGNEYRIGDKLLPDTEYTINDYIYKTDSKGRIISAEGKLRIEKSERNMEDVKKIDGQEYKKNDDRAHIIGHQFGGSDRLENIVPMDSGLNKGDYKKMENTLADAVKGGADVKLKVEPVYKGDSTRPSEFRVSYSIDGEKTVTVFRNESETKK